MQLGHDCIVPTNRKHVSWIEFRVMNKGRGIPLSQLQRVWKTTPWCSTPNQEAASASAEKASSASAEKAASASEQAALSCQMPHCDTDGPVVVLGCKHSFCTSCIESQMRVRKKKPHSM